MTGILTATLTVLLLALIFGALLGYAAVRFHVEGDPLVERIDALLPQTQCGQCGHPGCHPYAEAIAAGEAFNRCPPGGAATVQALADLLGQAPQPLDDPAGIAGSVRVARIREDECIGCTKCIQACPVDAILGAAKFMHTVIESECTGCDLCVEPCPVDCIDMVTLEPTLDSWHWTAPEVLIASDKDRGEAA
ncbi:electron transport complex subunit RsxB [Mangrovitalea sediminis]|uniref:electron transport complex subunit RsxB n=1 Tax=Mangrovitalea sediminis TaxID=1982043 RepID=UPI000BE5EFF6|nr:electron transport complex subunit RsxB [Mangrovitalea sediminis]